MKNALIIYITMGVLSIIPLFCSTSGESGCAVRRSR